MVNMSYNMNARTKLTSDNIFMLNSIAILPSIAYAETKTVFFLYLCHVIVLTSLLLWGAYIWRWIRSGVVQGKIVAIISVAVDIYALVCTCIWS